MTVDNNAAQKRQKLLHHIAVGCGFMGLILWFYIGRELGILDWAASLLPQEHAGAGLMLGIMLLMTPGFFIWSRYNRWVEHRLAIRGFYYETEYEEEQARLLAEKNAAKKSNQNN
ncbi:hypothetical protein ACFVYJ_08465 [Pontibacter sp. JAM-7]|uniref:hypothetical protein n=1 Tax=Pontibacter sp. JAM-7 TaxID=3366581 RepID=UPI003AF90767